VLFGGLGSDQCEKRMSYVLHHAIVVTSWDRDALTEAHAAASLAFPHVSPLVRSGLDDYESFFIPPDGGREGSQESGIGNVRRRKFLAWLNQHRRQDGKVSLEWGVVSYGGNHLTTRTDTVDYSN
jgi:hypothetical protein